MKRFIFVSLIVPVAILIFLATRCESSPETPVDTIQYENTHEETTPSHESVQYHNVELPDTGGLRI